MPTPRNIHPPATNVRSQARSAAISWRAIFGATLVALLVYFTLMSLGLAVGGHTLTALIEGRAQGFGIGSAIWVVLSGLIALFAGGYFVGRISNETTPRVGGAQGMVVAALFFALMVFQTGAIFGTIGTGIGAVVGGAGEQIGAIAESPQVQEAFSDILHEGQLQSPPGEVIQQTLSLLVQGDSDGAMDYLAQEIEGVEREELEQRFVEFAENLQETAEAAVDQAGSVMAAIGWTVFLLLVLGTLSAVLGGTLGVRANITRPFEDITAEEEIKKGRAA
jgi:hypothetical protein